MSRVLSVNNRQIWTRSRSQTLLSDGQAVPQKPTNKKRPLDVSAECLGFSAAEINTRSPPLRPLLEKKKLIKRSEPHEGTWNGKRGKPATRKNPISVEKKAPQSVKDNPQQSTAKPLPVVTDLGQRKRKDVASKQVAAVKRPRSNQDQVDYLATEDNPPLPAIQQPQTPEADDEDLPKLSKTLLRCKLPVPSIECNSDEEESPFISTPSQVTITKIPQIHTTLSPLQADLGKPLSLHQRNLLRINSAVSVSRTKPINPDMPSLTPSPPQSSAPKVVPCAPEPLKVAPKVKHMPSLIPIVKTKYPTDKETKIPVIAGKTGQLPKVIVVLSKKEDQIMQARKVLRIEAVPEPVIEEKVVKEAVQPKKEVPEPVIEEKVVKEAVQPKKEAPKALLPMRPKGLVGYKIPTTVPVKPRISVSQKTSTINDHARPLPVAQKKVGAAALPPPKKKIISPTVPRLNSAPNILCRPVAKAPAYSAPKPMPVPPKAVTPPKHKEQEANTSPIQSLEWKHNQTVLDQLKQAALSPNQEATHEKLLIMSDIYQQVEKPRTPPRSQVVADHQSIVPKTVIYSQNIDSEAQNVVLISPELFAEILAQCKQTANSCRTVAPSISPEIDQQPLVSPPPVVAAPKHQVTTAAVNGCDGRSTLKFTHNGVPKTVSMRVVQAPVVPSVRQKAPPKIEKAHMMSPPPMQRQIVPPKSDVVDHQTTTEPNNEKYVTLRYQATPSAAAHNQPTAKTTSNVVFRNKTVVVYQHQVVQPTPIDGNHAKVQQPPEPSGVAQNYFPQQTVAPIEHRATQMPVKPISPWDSNVEASMCNPTLQSQPPVRRLYDIKKIGNSSVITKKPPSTLKQLLAAPQPKKKAPVQTYQKVANPVKMIEKDGKFYAVIKEEPNNIELPTPQFTQVCEARPLMPSSVVAYNSKLKKLEDQQKPKYINNFDVDLQELQCIMDQRQAAGRTKKCKSKPKPKAKTSPGVAKKRFYYETIDLTEPEDPIVSVDLTKPPAMSTRRATQHRKLQQLETRLANNGVTMQVRAGAPFVTPSPTPVKKARPSYHTPDFVKKRLSFQYDESLTGIQLLQTPEKSAEQNLWAHDLHGDVSVCDFCFEMVDLLGQPREVMEQFEPGDFTVEDLLLEGLFQIPIGELFDANRA